MPVDDERWSENDGSTGDGSAEWAATKMDTATPDTRPKRSVTWRPPHPHGATTSSEARNWARRVEPPRVW